jgi:anti-sigma28 factor (negative regulator of flagellin synthesis)
MRIGEKSGVEPTGRPGVPAPQVRRSAVPKPRRDRMKVLGVARALAGQVGRIEDATLDPARAAQVEILRNRVSTGRYEPDLRAVARNLLAEIAAERRG